jgi:hypothetical protein
MPYKITKLEDGGVFIDYQGIVTSRENQEAHKKIVGQNPDQLKKIPYVISDFSKARNISHTSGEIREVATMSRQKLKLNPNLLLAIIVPSTLFYGLGRMWQVFLEDESNRAGLFRTSAEAEIWVQKKLAEK